MAANRHSAGSEAEAEQPDYSLLTESGREALAVAEAFSRSLTPSRGCWRTCRQVTVDSDSIDRVLPTG